MTSFRFRLERLRALRERREQLAQEQLAHSISGLQRSREQLRESQAGVEQALAEQRRATETARTLDGGELRARQAFLERMEQQRRCQEEQLTRSEAEVARSNDRLALAASEHQMLVRLRERRRGEHAREQSRIEGQANDELATIRFRRSVA